MREVGVPVRRRAFAAALVLSAAIGAFAAQAGLAPPATRSRIARRPIQPPPARSASGAGRRVAGRGEAASSAVAGDDAVTAKSGPIQRTGGAEREIGARIRSPRGEASYVDAFAGAADWKVLYEPPDEMRDALRPTPKLLALLARDGEAAEAVERSLGPPPWIDATFQACGFADLPVAVLGREFRAAASPAASAAWYAERAHVAVGDGRVAKATERLARFETERADILARVFDRIAKLAQGREDDDVTAYFVAADGVRLFRASESPDVDELAAGRRRLEETLRRRAREACE